MGDRAMNAMTEECDVVICGGGVGGLALAVALGRQGRRVILLERRRHDTHVHKGEFLQPRTLGIFEDWGTLPRLMQRGALAIKGMENRNSDGEYLGRLDYQLLPGPFNHGLVHYYHDIKGALYDSAKPLADLRFGARATELLRDSSGRIGGIRFTSEHDAGEIRARLVVGTDGMASDVREAAGIPGAVTSYGHQLMALDLDEVTTLDHQNIGFVSDDGVRVLYPMPGRRARLYVQIEHGELKAIKGLGMAKWKERLLRVTPGLDIIGDRLPADFKRAQVLGAWRFCAPTWVAPGLALAGDAAHCVHPIAGQGMNCAIVDAYELARALQTHARGGDWTVDSVDAALAEYDRARRPQFQHIARLCHYMSLYCTSRSALLRRAVHFMARANRENRRLQYILAYNMAGLGMRRFTWKDRLYQFGLLRDPNRCEIGLTATDAVGATPAAKGYHAR
jgi:2-polyprenyl-6-methoxyphenol hydroxylase-like FAD-dependent oxidoreductase